MLFCAATNYRRKKKPAAMLCGLLLVLCLTGCQVILNETNQIPPTLVLHSNGEQQESHAENAQGTIRITGEVAYTSPYFYFDNPDPYLTLYNIAPFYADEVPDSYEWIRMAQQLGMITTDPYTSPFAYQLLLPAQPFGPFVDLDRDDVDDAGVGIYTVNLVSNISGDPFLDFAYGDSLSSISSVQWGYDRENGDTLESGKLVIYAPDAQQMFPSGFGRDNVLFSEDDPLIPLAEGYTIVEIGDEPFEFVRAETAQVDLIEPESSARIDFTDLGYVEAFDKMFALMESEYAYTDYYDIDWKKTDPKWRQQIVQAENNTDYDAYASALYGFVRTFSDGHISVDYEEYPSFAGEYDGSVGIIVQETNRGEVFITDVLENRPADDAGIEPGAELIAINGTKPSDAISATEPYYPSGAPSDNHWRLEQMKYVERGKLGSELTLKYRNPDDPAEQTSTLIRNYDWDSYYQDRFYESERPSRPLPVEFAMLPGGYGHIKIYSFLDDKRLTLDLWNRAINTLIYESNNGLILDMRRNEGGVLGLAELMASYFFERNVALGAFTYYNQENDDDESDGFLYDEDSQRIMYPIPSELYYDGNIALLIGPDCSSACEFFSYAVGQSEKAQILGYYGSMGLGGAVESVYMPDGVIVSFTIGRAVDSEGNIHIEGVGVQPDVRVPVTRKAVLNEGDPLLEAAQMSLDVAALLR